jgi:hypothetical protein
MELTAAFTSNRDKFLECFANVPHFLLGKKLQPLCLLHFLWLEHIGSPLVETSKAIKISDLELAALICSSHSSAEILSKLSANTLQRRFWRFCNGFRNPEKETRRFLAYQDDYCSLPDFGDSGGEKNETIPWLLLQAASLIKETGWSEETVFTYPIGKLIWFNVAFGYLHSGETGVVSDKERAAMEALARLTSGG